MARAIVIGGGISGLAAAVALKDAGEDVLLLEAELVELGMRLLECEIGGRERDKPVFNFFLCGHKLDTLAPSLVDDWWK